MEPVVNKAEDYLSIGNRYGFEQIFLLAFLGLTRKLHVDQYLEWLLRKYSIKPPIGLWIKATSNP